MIVDMHNHFFPVEAVRAEAGADIVARMDGSLALMDPTGHATALSAELVDPQRQRALMAAQGIDRRTLVPPPFTLRYDLDAEAGIAWSRAVNNGIAETARVYSDAFIGFATVPLQSVPAAVAELDRAVGELGLQGVEIASNIAGVELDDPALEPFWARLAALGVPLLIHPHYVAGIERMGPYHLRNLIGNPLETALAGARLIFGGVLARHPGVKIILSHGGGALPGIVGRLEHGRKVRSDVPGDRPIAEALRRFYYDTIVFDPAALVSLVKTVGPDRIVVGTDAPFDMSEPDPAGFVRNAGLTGAEVETILGNGELLLANQ